MDDNIYAPLPGVEHSGVNVIITEPMYIVEMAEQLDTMSSVKLGGFPFQLVASYASSLTEEL